MITKPEVRSVVLGKLDLPERGVLWDVGAGSGSVAIEAALAAPGLRVIAIERDPGDAARVLANAAAVGALLEVVEGSAPAALVGLTPPDRVFVGGGGLEVLDAALAALAPGGRIVATFAAVDRAAEAHRRLGSLVQVGIHRAEVLPDGGVRFAADNPVFLAWGDRPGPAAPPFRRVAVGVGCSSAATTDEVADIVRHALAAANALGSIGAAGSMAQPESGSSATQRGEPSDGAGERSGGPRPSLGVVGVPVDTTPETTDGEGPSIADPVASEEPGGHRRDRRSSEEATKSDAPDPLTLRSQSIAVRPSAPQRNDPDLVLATIDRRLDHPAIVAAADDRPLDAFPASLLGLVDVPEPSEVVDAAVGTPSVAEAAALLAAGPGARLVLGKQRGATATAAVAVGDRPTGPGRVLIVGLGPGHPRHRTPASVAAVMGADAVIGYGPYVDAAELLLRPDQMVVRSAMGAEADRARSALALARAGWRVALVSSGDPGVFAMASVTLELAAAAGSDVVVEVVPGLTASSAAAAAVGAPLGGPHAVLTLSDLLLPWAAIEGQLRAAAGAGLALALYNPRSAGRPDHLARACAVLLEVLDPTTPVAVVSAATSQDQQVECTTLGALDPALAGMRSIVLVGTAETVDVGGCIVTRRHHPLAPVDQ